MEGVASTFSCSLSLLDGILLDLADSALLEGWALLADDVTLRDAMVLPCLEGEGLEKEEPQNESMPPQVELLNPLDGLFDFEMGGVEVATGPGGLVSDGLFSFLDFRGCFDCGFLRDDCDWMDDWCVGVVCDEGGVVNDEDDVVERSVVCIIENQTVNIPKGQYCC